VTDASRRPPHPATPRTLAALVRTLEDRGRGPLLAALLEAQARLGAAGAAAPGWEAETLALLADGFLERLAACGIRPVHRPGEALCLPAGRLAGRYEYHGSPLRPGQRRQRVVVVAPGWTVGRRLVVRPVVRELPDDAAGTRAR
jgi:hypothetical protein